MSDHSSHRDVKCKSRPKRQKIVEMCISIIYIAGWTDEIVSPKLIFPSYPTDQMDSGDPIISDISVERKE